MTRTKRLALTGLLAAGLLVSTSACDPAETGSAAVLGSGRITEGFVDETAQESLDVLGEAAAEVDGAELQRGIITNEIRVRVTNRLAAEQGIEVSQGEVDELLDGVIEQAGGLEQLELSVARNGIPPSQLETIARLQVTQDALIESYSDDEAEGFAQFVEAFEATIDDLGLTVSPRYGAFDAEELSVVAAESDLSVSSAS